MGFWPETEIEGMVEALMESEQVAADSTVVLCTLFSLSFLGIFFMGLKVVISERIKSKNPFRLQEEEMFSDCCSGGVGCWLSPEENFLQTQFFYYITLASLRHIKSIISSSIPSYIWNCYQNSLFITNFLSKITRLSLNL